MSAFEWYDIEMEPDCEYERADLDHAFLEVYSVQGSGEWHAIVDIEVPDGWETVFTQGGLRSKSEAKRRAQRAAQEKGLVK